MAKPKAARSTRTRTAESPAKARRKAAPAARKAAAPKPRLKAVEKPKARPKAKAAVEVKAAAKRKPVAPAKAAVPVKMAAPRPVAPARPAVAAKAQRPSSAKSPARRVRVKPAVSAPPAVSEWPDVGEQERVGALKFGSPVGRGFDEQRFLFPRNYEINRVRLVVRDPEWLFAYWDVNPRAFDGIRREMGERAMALSRLTLKVADPEGGHAQIILLPYGARSWYVRIDPAHRRYVAELGITLPSGQFRTLAQSNVVAMPRVGPSPHPAQRSVGFQEAWAAQGELATGVGEAESAEASAWIDPGTSMRPGPREAGGASDRLSAESAERREELGRDARRGGASDIFRR